MGTRERTGLEERAALQLDLLRQLGGCVAVSGGVAIHILMGPHREDRYIHDHSDIDLFILDEEFHQRIAVLGFLKVHSRFDGSSYLKLVQQVDTSSGRVKLLVDAFVEPGIPWISAGTSDEFRIVHPRRLLELYRERFALNIAMGKIPSRGREGTIHFLESIIDEYPLF